tara:strand:+ start:1994 stop:3055 length:1062 start_codon:yes stop_codon:yes gene_type:complete
MTNLFNSIYLNPREAIQQIAGKKETITWDWNELVGNMHNNAFTVAKMTSVDLLRDVKTAIKSAIAQGLSGPEFKKHLESRLRIAGWWGKQTRVNPKTGKSSTVVLGTPHRINTIFRTNTQSAYMAGMWRRFYDNRAARPYLEYVAILDGSTRPTHREINGFIAPITAAIWKVIFPPNGFNCRCRTRALTEKQAKQRGKKGLVPIPSTFPDNGFAGNPGAVYDINLVRALRAKAKRSKDMLGFKKFMGSQKRKDFLIEQGIPSIGATASAYMLTILGKPDGGTIELTINKPMTNPTKLVETLAALSYSIYRDKKTGELYVLQKGTKRTYFIFSKTGVYKKSRIVLFFSKRFEKQ